MAEDENIMIEADAISLEDSEDSVVEDIDRMSLAVLLLGRRRG